MKEITQQKKEMPVFDESQRELRIQPNMDKRHWYSRRYDYYCGDWRYDWHEDRKIEHGNGGAIMIDRRV